MKSVEQVAGAMGEADADPAAERPVAPARPARHAAAVDLSQRAGRWTRWRLPQAQPRPKPAHRPSRAPQRHPRAEPADPWAAILEAGAALLQGLAQRARPAAQRRRGAHHDRTRPGHRPGQRAPAAARRGRAAAAGQGVRALAALIDGPHAQRVRCPARRSRVLADRQACGRQHATSASRRAYQRHVPSTQLR